MDCMTSEVLDYFKVLSGGLFVNVVFFPLGAATIQTMPAPGRAVIVGDEAARLERIDIEYFFKTKWCHRQKVVWVILGRACFPNLSIRLVVQ